VNFRHYRGGQAFDLLVCGGGIYVGRGRLTMALRGLKVALVETGRLGGSDFFRVQ
jgi:glycerol-3-phosphate dehydrogenase